MTSTPEAPGQHVPLAAGELVGTDEANRWEIVGHLADGGFSSVYEVKPGTPETAEKYGSEHRALKSMTGTPAELSNIDSEAEKIAAVEGHGNVLGLITSLRFDLEARPDDHFVGLILELAGEDLYGFARRMRPGELAWAAIFEQVAAGLEHIHARNVVHGDIKPTNILRVGADFRIADFGVSAPLDTGPSAAIGIARTMAYWPPESCDQGTVAEDGTRQPPTEGWQASQADDVWALAVSMHRMLTGRHITAGSTPQQQYNLICQGRYSIDDRLDPGWRALFADLLAHRPEDRSVTTAAVLRRRLSELALPEDYVGVPWTDGAPRIVAALQDEKSVGTEGVLLLYLTRAGGRVQSRLVPAGDPLLAVVRHLHGTAVPALAQQVRDAQRTAARLTDERDRLQVAVDRAARGGPETEPMPATEATQEVQRLSAEVTAMIGERDQLAAAQKQLSRARDDVARERDQLARQHRALAKRVSQLETDLDRSRIMTVTPGAELDYPDYTGYQEPAAKPAKPWQRRLGGCLVIVIAFLGAVTLGLLLAAGLASISLAELWHHFTDWLADRGISF
ncbi:MAG TPA: protein kinase [Actinomycetes bacterium]|nr:protein kinase [Actinomycetes bacterium]